MTSLLTDIHKESAMSMLIRLLWISVLSLLFCGCGKFSSRVDEKSNQWTGVPDKEQSFDLPEQISFSQHIRPILSDRCFACHGPDVDNQLSPFRMNTAEASRMNLSKEGDPPRYGIVPGKPDESVLIHRVSHEDPAQRMPPVAANKKRVSSEEIALLRKWIEEGAEYEKHWAFVAPEKPELPKVQKQDWVRNDIDRFVLAKLENKGIAPAPEADKETLIRRLYIDLTGLPPTPEEIDAFVEDSSETAYEALVDRVMASPHFGERMAIDWLDAARYGDSNALHVDLERSSWPWRDWVIKAFNNNMPYSQFIIEQLAGDLLPNATVEQKVATAFNRNHGINNEGGTIPEEFLVEYAVDRVSTMGSAMMGLTLGCARCHDHKYDPISQDDFFSLTSFFNNIPEKGLENQNEFHALAYPPFIYVYTEEEKTRKNKADKILAEVKALKKRDPKELPPLPGNEKAVKWTPLTLSKVHSDKSNIPPVFSIKTKRDLRGNANNKVTQIKDTKKIHFRANAGVDPAVTLSFEGPATLPFNTIRIEATATPPGGKGGGDAYGTDLDDLDSLLAEIEVEVLQGKQTKPIHIVRGYSSLDSKGEQFAAALDGDTSTAWNMGTPQFSHHLFLQLNEPVTVGEGKLQVRLHYKGNQRKFKFYNDLVFYTGSNPHNLDEPVALIPPNNRVAWHKDVLLVERAQAAGLTELTSGDYLWATGQKPILDRTATRCMVMQEKKDIRPTYVLHRGAYDAPLKDRPRERVTPAVFPPMSEDAPKNRLGLAQWLVSDEHPLTSRIAINRFWQQLFEHGIVKTSEDFGLQSDLPSHPGLLDYLAVDFIENDWDVKRLMKMFVMSATYRQSSQFREDIRDLDPDNRLLAQAPRYRFPAEVIRDNALTASGMLNDSIGGPSVRPYQPDGLWKEKTMRASASTGTYVRDKGEKLYRRGMYTFWKQAVPPPQMELFDAPSREACTIKRRTTITPLQALMLMNDETYLEISRELAARLFKEIEGDWNEQLIPRLERGLRLSTGRKPAAKELESWIQFANENLARFSSEPEDAKSFLAYGEKPVDASLPEAELAALAFTMSTVLNLDETITRD